MESRNQSPNHIVEKQSLNVFQLKWKNYVSEATGLGLFMVSVCFFSMLLEGRDSYIHTKLPYLFHRNIIMGLLMGLSALFIFYFPFTAASGSHINPAVTITYIRLNRIGKWDAAFYILFQITGGLLSVFLMRYLLGNHLASEPVNFAVTKPGRAGVFSAAAMELFISFITMFILLLAMDNPRLKKYTRLFAALLIFIWVNVAGPVSGFGMNPARSLASAVPSQIWTAFWIYVFMPVIGMLGASECFLLIISVKKKASMHDKPDPVRNSQEFVL